MSIKIAKVAVKTENTSLSILSCSCVFLSVFLHSYGTQAKNLRLDEIQEDYIVTRSDEAPYLSPPP